jgi:hypothetical protein
MELVERAGVAMPVPSRQILLSLVPLAQQPKPSEKSLTAFPLRELSPEKAAKELERYAESGAVLTPVPRDKTLLIYADEQTRKAIEDELAKLDVSPRVTTVLQVTVDPEQAVGVLRKCFPQDKMPLMVALRAEGRILLYADPETTRTVLHLLEPAVKVVEKTFEVEFRDADWADVFAWYGKISGLTFISAVKPPGKCTLTPGKDKRFTLGEVTHLLIEAVTPHKLSFARLEKSFLLWPTGEGCGLYTTPRITLAELPRRGKLELVQVIIPLPGSIPVEEHELELKKMLGPHGSLFGLVKPNSILIRDTVGNIGRLHEALKVFPGYGEKKP